MATAHTFVQEVIKVRGPQEATDLEKKCTIAVMDVLYRLSGEEARKAVLAVHAMMAWEGAPLAVGDLRITPLDEVGEPVGSSLTIRVTPPL